ncbi:MAG: molybdenum cofactor biosynthesis protein MoaE [Alcaligenaceae bacterium]|nr:molybdenum cofactor biosynthesis protein MoaE [Alcaligenaceae bacterium]
MYTITIQEDDFDLAQEMAKAEAAASNAGAVVSFTGRVRGHDYDKPLSHLFLEYFPGVTEKEIEKIILQAQQQWPILYVRVIHRVGRINTGEDIVLVLTASEHRKAAYQANEFIMDYLKTRAPFWKKEHFMDGDANWVEMKQSDLEHTQSWQA